MRSLASPTDQLPPLNSSIDNPSGDVGPTDTALLYGSHGYVTAASDYLGLGLSKNPYHPYLQAESEGSAVVDSLRAARKPAAILNVSLSGQVFIAGASQGGHVALAAQRQGAGESNVRTRKNSRVCHITNTVTLYASP